MGFRERRTSFLEGLRFCLLLLLNPAAGTKVPMRMGAEASQLVCGRFIAAYTNQDHLNLSSLRTGRSRYLYPMPQSQELVNKNTNKPLALIRVLLFRAWHNAGQNEVGCAIPVG